jgi:hypothetical protein
MNPDCILPTVKNHTHVCQVRRIHFMRGTSVTLIMAAGAGLAAVVALASGFAFRSGPVVTAPPQVAAEQPRSPAGDGSAEVRADPCFFTLEHPPIVCRLPSQPVNFRVGITNHFNTAVQFRDFACDCGCSSGKFSAQELQPGQAATVEMTVVLAGREGPQRFTCRWFDGTGRQWSATVRVTVYRRSQFAQKALRLGILEPGTVVQRSLSFDEYSTAEEEFSSQPKFTVSSIQNDPMLLVRSSPFTSLRVARVGRMPVLRRSIRGIVLHHKFSSGHWNIRIFGTVRRRLPESIISIFY